MGIKINFTAWGDDVAFQTDGTPRVNPFEGHNCKTCVEVHPGKTVAYLYCEKVTRTTEAPGGRRLNFRQDWGEFKEGAKIVKDKTYKRLLFIDKKVYVK